MTYVKSEQSINDVLKVWPSHVLIYSLFTGPIHSSDYSAQNDRMLSE